MVLKAWNKYVLGRVNQKIVELEEIIRCLEESLQIDEDELIEQILFNIKQELGTWEKGEEIRLYQIAKNKWFKEEDQN